ncbi:cryptochrome/photolyase family protein [Mucilaginibacter psychrotolerans]|uniref:Deoxyribodipyrimidine photo-lyase n=1 Tax=Mucilaginibacter psychrotolerans TaxID=1524096 RepID=A0A4Y8SFZ7_9SPHI|nr:deoxyribodipyrimidine photo-lyase [Mucilaginibacter psychrotolerans]TFF37560.1 deoxyribodipyrimidine photo-lyase [Mucilaginibacter psychrotolerans]
MDNTPITIFWHRRDLRLNDNAGLYRALNSGHPVLPVFIFDKDILDALNAEDDARVNFIYDTITKLKAAYQKHGSDLLVFYDQAEHAIEQLIKQRKVTAVYTNHDYEPAANKRDDAVAKLLAEHSIDLKTFKDQVIFERDEVAKDDGKPYTVFTPYKNKWYQKLKPFYLKAYPTEKYLANLYQFKASPIPSLKEMGFTKSDAEFPGTAYEKFIADYAEKRDFPAVKGTSHIGLHLRFGTVSIRQLATNAFHATEKTWLNELIWREFYMMVLHHFPQTAAHAFKPDYDNIKWINNEEQFKAWCNGQTGYPMVDAGMRELNATGFMHNRVRMLTASFLTKHLLIDWRWGEAYFAQKLLDYEMASNVGGWQWAAGCGTDAAPYFRIFNPEAQMKKFDPKMEYIKKWVPEYADFSTYPKPIVNHAFARERCLKAFKEALS